MSRPSALSIIDARALSLGNRSGNSIYALQNMDENNTMKVNR
jgi:hypothetical protein